MASGLCEERNDAEMKVVQYEWKQVVDGGELESMLFEARRSTS
jgi:hypothetical protein